MGSGKNLGKQWEAHFKQDWNNSFPESVCLRLPDSQSGYYGVANPCDFICFEDCKLFMMELKCHKGNTLPFSCISQYEKLLHYKNKPNVFPGIIMWWIDLDKIAWINIKDIEQMKLDNKKSIHIDMLKNKEYNIIEIPSTKKRLFLTCDYKPLLNIGGK